MGGKKINIFYFFFAVEGGHCSIVCKVVKELVGGGGWHSTKFNWQEGLVLGLKGEIPAVQEYSYAHLWLYTRY